MPKHILQTMKILRNLPCALAAVIALASCGKADNRFSSYDARFSYSPVTAVPNLYRACTSMGEFCSITYPPGNRYVIKSPSMPSAPDYIVRTAIQGYQEFILGLGGGLIIGLPNMPEMLEQESHVTCYDMCCPNCYKSFNTLKQLELRTDGTALCQSCNRTYDLNNQGIIARGDAGRSLFRYYVHYNSFSQTLTVNNG